MTHFTYRQERFTLLGSSLSGGSAETRNLLRGLIADLCENPGAYIPDFEDWLIQRLRSFGFVIADVEKIPPPPPPPDAVH